MLNQLKNIFSKYIKTNELNKFNENTIILRDLNINSLELMSLVCDVEDNFNIEIPDKEIKKIITINDLITFIKSYK